MRKNHLYYHMYLTQDIAAWSSILMEHMWLFETADLLNTFDKLSFTLIASHENQILQAQSLIDFYTKKYELTCLQSPFNSDYDMVNNINSTSRTVRETVTLKKMWEDAQKNDENILYFHAKGLTAYHNWLAKGNAERFATYYGWRQFLNWGLVENWQTCTNALDIFDTAGVNYQIHPSPHYSGNLWWSKSEHVRSLPDPMTDDWWHKIKEKTTDSWLKSAEDRFKDEMWICSRPDTKSFNIESPNPNPAFTYTPKNKY